MEINEKVKPQWFLFGEKEINQGLKMPHSRNGTPDDSFENEN